MSEPNSFLWLCGIMYSLYREGRTKASIHISSCDQTNIGISMQQLLESITRRTENSKWLGFHYGELTQRFDSQWVAVYDKKVVAHGKNLPGMSKTLRAKYGERFGEIAFDYISKKPIELIL